MTERREIPKEKPLKLDGLKRENIFRTPDAYFDRLPAQIQARIKKQEDYGFRPVLVTSLKLALPVIILAVVIFQMDLFAPDKSSDQDPMALIDEVSTQDLVAYLGETDITAEEILEEIDFQNIDLDFSVEGALLLDDVDLENSEINLILEEYGIEGDYL